MKIELLTFILISFTFATLGCSSQMLRVQSTPDGADVIILSQNMISTKLGKTPLEIDPRTSPGLFADSPIIRVTKEGYLPQSAMVPNLSSLGGSGKINFTLADAELPKSCIAQENSLNDVARGVAEVSGLIQRKRLSEASELIQALVLKYPTVAPLYDLQGNILFLQKNTSGALMAYKKSITILPNNPQTLKMIDRLSLLQVSPTGGR